jgi:hypothetical protein
MVSVIVPLWVSDTGLKVALEFNGSSEPSRKVTVPAFGGTFVENVNVALEPALTLTILEAGVILRTLIFAVSEAV